MEAGIPPGWLWTAEELADLGPLIDRHLAEYRTTSIAENAALMAIREAKADGRMALAGALMYSLVMDRRGHGDLMLAAVVGYVGSVAAGDKVGSVDPGRN